jgi:hypothetical protein
MTEEFNPYEPPADVVGGAPLGRAEAEGQITESMLESLRMTRPWVLFLAILTFVAFGFMALAAVAMVIAGIVEARDQAALIGAGAFYLVLAAIYFFIAFYLVKYARSIGVLNLSGRSEHLEDALWAQQKFWKVSGIVTIAMIALFVVGMIGMIVLAAVVGI